MLTPQAFKTEVVWSTFVLRLSSSLSFCNSSVCAKRPQGVPSTFLWNSFSSGIPGFPPWCSNTWKPPFTWMQTKCFYARGEKIVCCTWNYLLFMSVRVSACADISQVVHGVLVILSTPWVSCEKPPSDSSTGVLKSCPVPQPREAAPLDGKNVSALEVHEKCGFWAGSWCVGCVTGCFTFV